MPCLVTFCLLISALGADEKLVPRARVESGGEVVWAQVSPDGARLVGTVKDGKQCDLVAWNLPGGSKNVLLKGFDLGLGNFLFSPDGKSLAGVVLRMRGADSCDRDDVVWDAPSMSKTVLRQAKGTQALVVAAGTFSPDSSILAVPDGMARKVRVWKRGPAAKWSLSRVLDVGRGADARKPALLELVFAPDGRHIFALIRTIDEAALDGMLAIEKWNVASGERVAFPAKPVRALVWLWTMELVFVGGGKTLWIQRAEGDGGGVVGIDTLSGKEKYNLPLWVGGTLVSPDGRTGAVLGGDPGTALEWAGKPRGPSVATVAFWNFDDGTGVRAVTANGGAEAPLGAFTADSRFFVLAAGDDKHHIHVIDVKKAGIRSSFTVDGPVKGLFLLDSGEIAAVGTEPKAIVIWRIKTQ